MTAVVIPPVGDLPALLSGEAPMLLAGAGLDVHEAVPNYLRLKPDAALVGLNIRFAGSGGIEERCGYVRTFTSSSRAAVLHHKRADTGAGLLPGGRSVLFVFPADAGLTRLRHIVDPAGLKRSLAPLAWVGGDGWRVRGHRSEVAVVSYRPERRVVVRARLALRRDGDRRRLDVFVRGYPDRRGRKVAAHLHAAHRAVPSPVPLGITADGRLAVESAVDGATLAERTASADPVEIAAMLATLHRAPPMPGPSRTLADAALAATRALGQLQAVLPATASHGDSIGRILADAPAADATPSLVHGDLHAEQILLGACGPALVDFDRAGIGDPMIDLGTLIADLRVRGHHTLAQRLATAYVDATPDRGAAGLRFALGCGLVERALLAFRTFQPGWPETVPAVLAETAALLAAPSAQGVA